MLVNKPMEGEWWSEGNSSAEESERNRGWGRGKHSDGDLMGPCVMLSLVW